MEREIQLLLFSQPHPFWVFTHNGYTVPYQLHCCAVATLDTGKLLALLDEIDAEETPGSEDLGGIDEAARDDVADETPPQTLPVITGRSALPPRLSI